MCIVLLCLANDQAARKILYKYKGIFNGAEVVSLSCSVFRRTFLGYYAEGMYANLKENLTYIHQ